MAIALNPLTKSLNYEGEELFLVEGTLSEVQHAHTRVNLLEQIEKRALTKNLATGVAAAISGMHGVLASSAMLAMYDGEDMVNFAGLLGDLVICGTFQKADAFKDGDKIKAVVSKRGDVLSTHAVMRENDKMLFMPLSSVRGAEAHFWSCMKHARNVCLFGWIFFFGMFSFFIFNSEKQKNFTDYIFLFFLAFFIPLFMFPMEYWTFKSTRFMGERASAIFKVFGFPRPDDVDLIHAIHYKFPEDNTGVNGVANYEKALEQHAKRFNLN
jgi:hypothetical protein